MILDRKILYLDVANLPISFHCVQLMDTRTKASHKKANVSFMFTDGRTDGSLNSNSTLVGCGQIPSFFGLIV